MGPIWGRQDPGGPHDGAMSLAIWKFFHHYVKYNGQIRSHFCTCHDSSWSIATQFHTQSVHILCKKMYFKTLPIRGCYSVKSSMRTAFHKEYRELQAKMNYKPGSPLDWKSHRSVIPCLCQSPKGFDKKVTDPPGQINMLDVACHPGGHYWDY